MNMNGMYIAYILIVNICKDLGIQLSFKHIPKLVILIVNDSLPFSNQVFTSFSGFQFCNGSPTTMNNKLDAFEFVVWFRSAVFMLFIKLNPLSHSELLAEKSVK